MEPPSSTSSRKRKQKFSTEPDDGVKRSKCDEKTPQEGRTSGSPRISVPFSRLQQPVSLLELTQLLHYAALGRPAGVQQPSWCRLLHQRRIRAVNVVVVDGLTQSLFYKHYLSLTHLRSRYSTRVTFTPSPSSLASGIFSSQVHASGLQKHSRDLPPALRTHPVITRFGTQTRGLTAYVLSQEEMIRRHFPVRGLPGFEDFVCTDVDDITDSSPLFGLDCEMCLTQNGYELTRVSLVDSDGVCILDQLVKPQTPIIDYLTRFSGVTAAMLQPIRTSLRDVQMKLRTLLPSNAVLVGHSLNNDLMVLKMIHRHVIDSSLLFRGEFGRRFKLKVLAETVLRRRIQTKDEEGHDPSEDAVAALQLVQYFIRTGPRQVVERHLEDLWGYELQDSEGPPAASLRFADVLQALGQSVGFIGRRGDMSLDLSNQVWLSSDRQVRWEGPAVLHHAARLSPAHVTLSCPGGFLLQGTGQASFPVCAAAVLLLLPSEEERAPAGAAAGGGLAHPQQVVCPHLVGRSHLSFCVCPAGVLSPQGHGSAVRWSVSCWRHRGRSQTHLQPLRPSPRRPDAEELQASCPGGV
ncbi:uncharacterized protein V6R79_002254 [Siganus canaliculatus]